jgi:hypothetical protein
VLIKDGYFVGLDVVIDILGEERAVLLQVGLLLLFHMIFSEKEDLPSEAEPFVIRFNEIILSGGRELFEPFLDVLDDDPQVGILLSQLLQLQSWTAILLCLPSKGRIENLVQMAQLAASAKAIRALEVGAQELR